MEIFIRGISYIAQYERVHQKMVEILHEPPFSTPGEPLNFHLHLHRDGQQKRPHGGTGVLTVPTKDVGLLILAEYGPGSPRRVIINERPISFETSRRAPRPNLASSLQQTPYSQPLPSGSYTSYIEGSKIQFGRECRDSIFSPEWEHVGHFRLVFDFASQEIGIEIARFQLPKHSDPSLGYDLMDFSNLGDLDDGEGIWEGCELIFIKFSSVRFLSAHSHNGAPVLYFDLYLPPNFERKNQSIFELDDYNHNVPSRIRLPSFALPGHARLAPFLSTNLRLLCQGSYSLVVFSNMVARAGLRHRFDSAPREVHRRQLYTPQAFEELDTHFAALPWGIAFQTEALLRNLVLDIQELLSILPNIHELLASEGEKYTIEFIRYFSSQLSSIPCENNEDDPITKYWKVYLSTYRIPSEPTWAENQDIFGAMHAKVTPTSIRLEGPFPERSNRVIRSFRKTEQAFFIRVSFVEEDCLHYRFNRDIIMDELLSSRALVMLKHGFTIGGRTFNFLAYSQSGLREHSAWFMTAFEKDGVAGQVVTPESIIAGLGTFDDDLMRCPARYAARISQTFTATSASVSVNTTGVQIRHVEDVERGGSCFTDGVGYISPTLARDMWSRSRDNKATQNIPPAAFQIRFMGSKGMVSVNYRLQGRVISLRPSMIKFEAPNAPHIEICRAFTSPSLYYMNRPLIMLLEGLGVPIQVFKRHQDLAIDKTRSALRSLADAAEMFEQNGLGASFRISTTLRGLSDLGIINLGGSFYHDVLEDATYHVLRELKHRSRIPIPGGWTLVGVADEHNYLEENEIFVCVTPVGRGPVYLSGQVIISRSPCIHPGDVQLARAIGKPPPGTPFDVEPICNTVVFSVKGKRSLPSQLGGGDLDGDEYGIIPLEELPEFASFEPMLPGLYPPAERVTLNRPSTREDIADFFVDYIRSDILGVIATTWLRIADMGDILCNPCLKLAKLHSDAVDYPKTGLPVARHRIPRAPKQLPDWMAPETLSEKALLESENYYRSDSAIGKLFRGITLSKIRRARIRRRRGLSNQYARHAPGSDDDDDDNDRLDAQPNEDHYDVLRNQIMEGFQHAENELVETIDSIVQCYLDADTNREDEDTMHDVYSDYVHELRYICEYMGLNGAGLTEAEVVVGTIMQRTTKPKGRQRLISKLREQTGHLTRDIRARLRGPDDDADVLVVLKRAWVAWKVSMRGDVKSGLGAKSFGFIALGLLLDVLKDIRGVENRS